jgi:DeoR family transcriptional regulator, aga operon transcriptional repressor
MNKRSSLILEEVLRDGRLSVEELAMRLGVSEVSLRRDLRSLEAEGLLRRDHGGAVPVEPVSYTVYSQDSSFQEQLHRNEEEKRHIGIAAANLIHDGESIVFTAGTTTTQVARSLLGRQGLRIFTNAVNIAMELGGRPEITTVLTGGIMRGSWFSLIGAQAQEAAANVFVDTAIFGASGIEPDAGVTDSHVDEAPLTRTLVMHARRRVLVVDSSKLGVRATQRICGIRDVHVLVTSKKADSAALEPYRAAGVEVIQA